MRNVVAGPPLPDIQITSVSSAPTLSLNADVASVPTLDGDFAPDSLHVCLKRLKSEISDQR